MAIKLPAVPPLLLWGGVAAVVGLLILTRKGVAANLGASIGGGAVDLVGGVIKGANDSLPAVIRPTSDQNVFFRASNLPGQILTGNDEWTIGGWIYDVTNKGE